MSGWGMGWFGGGGGGGGSSQKNKESVKNAILKLRQTYDMQVKREQHLQRLITEQETQAKTYLAANNKNAAKAALRRKKTHEQQLEQTFATMMTLDKEISSLEAANMNKETMEALKGAGKALKTLHNGMNLDTIDQTMEDLADQHAIGDQIAEAISQGVNNHLDEDELEDELEQLQQDALDEKMLKTGAVPASKVDALPSTPRKISAPAVVEDEDEEAELRQLQAEMAM